jgi:hypothetical protein
MGLVYQRWSPNQRIDSADLNDGAQFPLTNLSVALSAFLQPVAGIYRGGRVHQTGSPSKNVIVDPLAGRLSALELLVLQSAATLAVPDNVSGQPRIDLVSVHLVVTDDAPQSRWFWNAVTALAFTQDTVVRRQVNAVAVLTTGTPAGSPVAPPLPAGHLALATIAVAAGFSSIVDADISRSVVPDPLQIVQFTGPGGTHSLAGGPYVMEDNRLRVSTRNGGQSLVFAQLQVNSNNALNVAAMHTRLAITIEEVGGAAIAESVHRFHVGEGKCVWLAGLVTGPKDAVDYQVRFEDLTGAETAWGSVNVTGDFNLFGAISL